MILWVSASYEFVCEWNRNELISCSRPYPTDVIRVSFFHICYLYINLCVHDRINNDPKRSCLQMSLEMEGHYVCNKRSCRSSARSSDSAQFDSDKRRIGFGRNSRNRIARPGTQIIRAPKLANFVNPIKEVKNKAEPQLASSILYLSRWKF